MIIDVSHWQGKIDWQKVKVNDPVITGVFIKATQGVGSQDEMCMKNAVGAKAAGLQVGYYHFATLNSAEVVKDASAEAEYFVKVLRTLPGADLPVVLDIEENKGNLSKTDTLTWINTFFKRLRDFGYGNYALYSYTPFLDANLPGNHNLGSIPLWIAQYTDRPAPKLPKGWAKQWLWQYTAKGSIQGIAGNVDLNK